jgi:hypothetical protein
MQVLGGNKQVPLQGELLARQPDFVANRSATLCRTKRGRLRILPNSPSQKSWTVCSD